LSDSDIKEITTSEFSTFETKPVTPLETGEFNQALISSGAFVPDDSEKLEKPVEPYVESVKPEPQEQPVGKSLQFKKPSKKPSRSSAAI